LERGILNAMQDHFEMAEKDFQDAANLAPTDNSAYVGLGVTFLETGDAARAIPLLRTRLKNHPGDANLSYLLGEALLRSGVQPGDPAFPEAQSALEKAVRLDPKLVEPHISLGTVYLREGRLQDAVVQLERARNLDPYANSAYSHLAIAYRRLGNIDKSRQVLTELKEVVDRERTGSREQLSSAQNSQTSAAKPTTPQ
jgi:predicted Zn-dependent protease